MPRTHLSLCLKLLCAKSTSNALLVAAALFVGMAGDVQAAPHVEFDFTRAAMCRELTCDPKSPSELSDRRVELVLPVSVRFHGLTRDDVEELDIEINAAGTGLAVQAFSPGTELKSDIAQKIETTTTTKRDRSLAATLGGELPVPYGDFVAHMTPSIQAGLGDSKIATEKMNRLPPKQAIIVSGTLSQGCGVFFKLKPSSQTSLEGVHQLSVTFLAPASWRGSDVRVSCSAHGQRKVLWIKQPAVIGSAAGNVRLYPANMHPATSRSAHYVAKPVATAAEAGPSTSVAMAIAEMISLLPVKDAADAAGKPAN
jgi:hypothetical protein